MKRILSGVGLRAAGWVAVVALLFSVVAAQSVQAQSPNAAAAGAAKSDEGFYPGWSLGTRFEGSTSGHGRYTISVLEAATISRIISE